MSSRIRNRRIAVALVLGGLILPLPSAASTSRAIEGWERAWGGLVAWLGFGGEEDRILLTGWSSSYIDPNGGQTLPNAVTPPDDPASSGGPDGEDR